MKAFFDSNVVVYAFAEGDSAKGQLATQMLEQHRAQHTLTVSVQVLMETYNALTRRKGAAPADALAAVRLLAQAHVFSPSPQTALRALELAAAHRLHTWDSLIVQAAIEAECTVLYSEDLPAGRRFGTLEVVNPFVPQSGATELHRPAPTKSAARKPAKRTTATRKKVR
jgi:predicted nucleic acid-binding protein